MWELSESALEEKYTPGSLSLGEAEREGDEVDGNARRVSAQVRLSFASYVFSLLGLWISMIMVGRLIRG